MILGMRRGTKPSKWKKGASVGFAAYFARRSEPLNLPPEEEPLAEATGAGLKWIFTGFGDETTQVRATSRAPIRNVVLGVTGALIALGHGETPGEGSCEAYYIIDEVEVAAGTPGAVRRVRGGTGDLQLRLADGRTVWCSSHHCRPWQPPDDNAIGPDAQPASPAPPPADDDAAPPPPPPPPPPPLRHRRRRSPSTSAARSHRRAAQGRT